MQEGGNLVVRCSTLDEFISQEGISGTRLIKIDAAGNERAVLKGGAALFTGGHAPLVILKLYHPEVVKERFGYDAKEIVEILQEWGYRLAILKDGQRSSIALEELERIFGKHTYGFTLLAWREK